MITHNHILSGFRMTVAKFLPLLCAVIAWTDTALPLYTLRVTSMWYGLNTATECHSNP